MYMYLCTLAAHPRRSPSPLTLAAHPHPHPRPHPRPHPGIDIAGYIYSPCNSIVITTFNTLWRKIALALAEWENYRLAETHKEQLTYKLFIFQCINCYFSLLYIAFLKPYGITLFGVQMARCPIRAYGED